MTERATWQENEKGSESKDTTECGRLTSTLHDLGVMVMTVDNRV
jgi:hypothetical protein